MFRSDFQSKKSQKELSETFNTYLNKQKLIQSYPMELISTRTQMVDWLIFLCHNLSFRCETLFRAVSIFDLYIAKVQHEVVFSIYELKLVAIASLSLATKIEEINCNFVNFLTNNVLNGENPSIDIKTNGTYDSSLTEMMLERYVKTQNTFRKLYDDEKTIIKNINDSLSKKSEMIINSKLDAGEMSNISFYYSFASYSIMAVVIYIVCLVLGSFHKEYVNKRIIISEMDYKKHNWLLLISSFGYGLLVWILYNLIGVMILGKTVFTLNGLWYVINSFVFTLCSLTMALFISSLVSNKNAIAGVVNVVALGSAFLCGAFIPMSMLPDGVLKFAHVLPSYWYIKSNELLKTMEIFDLTNLKPILLNLGMLLLFSVIFIILNNYVTRKKRSI